MEGLSWKCLALLVIALCHIIAAAPAIDTAESSLDINPLTLDVSTERARINRTAGIWNEKETDKTKTISQPSDLFRETM